MVTSDFSPEVEIRPVSACAMYPAIIIGTVRSLLTWLWGRYHVLQNAFLVVWWFWFWLQIILQRIFDPRNCLNSMFADVSSLCAAIAAICMHMTSGWHPRLLIWAYAVQSLIFERIRPNAAGLHLLHNTCRPPVTRSSAHLTARKGVCLLYILVPIILTQAINRAPVILNRPIANCYCWCHLLVTRMVVR